MEDQDAHHYLDSSKKMAHGLLTMIIHQFIKINIHGIQELMFFTWSLQQVLDFQLEIQLLIELIMIIHNHLIALMLLIYGIHYTLNSSQIPYLYQERAMEAFMYLILHGKFINLIISVEC
jgi:hypothetical protein